MIVQRKGQMTLADALALAESSRSILDVCESTDNWDLLFGDNRDFSRFGVAIKNCADPLTEIPEWESSPGLWIFDDAETGISFLFWSDAHKESPFRGTSIEIILPENQATNFVDALGRLKALLLDPADLEVENPMTAKRNRNAL